MKLGCGMTQVIEIVKTVQGLVQGCSDAEDWVVGNVSRDVRRRFGVKTVRDAVRLDRAKVRDKGLREALCGLPDPRIVARASLEVGQTKDFLAKVTASSLKLEVSIVGAGGPGVYRSSRFVKAKPYTYYIIAGKDEKVQAFEKVPNAGHVLERTLDVELEHGQREVRVFVDLDIVPGLGADFVVDVGVLGAEFQVVYDSAEARESEVEITIE